MHRASLPYCSGRSLKGVAGRLGAGAPCFLDVLHLLISHRLVGPVVDKASATRATSLGWIPAFPLMMMMLIIIIIVAVVVIAVVVLLELIR